MKKNLETVVPYEKKPYSSEPACDAAGKEAYAALGESVSRNRWLFDAAQWYQEIRHNTIFPCSVPGMQ